MNKKINNNEIDLSEIILSLINNKWKIILITLITTFFALVIFQTQTKNNNEVIFLAETKIVSNSIFEDYEYEAFNIFIDNLRSKNIFLPNQNDKDKKENSEDLSIVFTRHFNLFENFNFDQINRLFLLELFIEKIEQKDFFIKSIIKYNLIDKEKFKNDEDYEKAVLKLASSIKIEKIKEDEITRFAKITFKTNDKENWEKFLNFIEKSANKEIQNYLQKKFNLVILNIEKISSYIIEDIQFEITNNKDNLKNILELNKIKRRIIESRDLNRLKNLYNDTPIINSNNFTAAKIKFQSTEYQDITKYPTSIIKIIIIASLLGLLLGIIYVLIVNVVQNRR